MRGAIFSTLPFVFSASAIAADTSACPASKPLAMADSPQGKMHIRGRVFLPDGKPAAGLPLSAEDVIGNHEDPWTRRLTIVITGPDGAFEFAPAKKGSYIWGANIDSPGTGRPYYRKSYYPGVEKRAAAKALTLDEGKEVRDLCFQLPPDLPSGTIEQPVMLQREDGSPGPQTNLGVTNEMWRHRTEPVSKSTDEKGQTAVQLRPKSRYLIWAQVPSPQGRQCAAPVEVDSDAPIHAIKLILKDPAPPGQRASCHPPIPADDP